MSDGGPILGRGQSTGTRVAIVGAARTPIGKFRGELHRVPAVILGQVAAREALARAGVRADQVNETLIGHGIQAGMGQNTARQVALGIGIPVTSGATTINKVCGSGMKAVTLGAAAVRVGDLGIALTGGMESMDKAPHILLDLREGIKFGDDPLRDAMLLDSLLDAYDHQHMGVTGEDVARRYGITRAEADQFSFESNRKAIQATEQGWLKDEIVPVPASITGNHELTRDEGPRADSSVEKLSKLKPAFLPEGILTAGNSSQLSDGAAALVLASESRVQELGLKPLAWVHSYHTSGVEPSRVMESPIPTVREHLAKTGLTVEDIDLFEHNEAFSTASIAVRKALNIPAEKFNVHGGAVALGHPIGCSGTRIIVTLLYAMRRRNVHRGLATLCMGGGNGMSVILESP